MNYNYQEANLEAGDVIRVTLDKQANVILLDNSNYQRFKSGRDYKHFGGLATRSPVDIVVPSTGHWYLVINTGGYPGSVRYSTQVIK